MAAGDLCIRIRKITSNCVLRSAGAHNLRTGKPEEHINYELTPKNEYLVGSAEDDFLKKKREILKSQCDPKHRKIRKNAVLAFEAESHYPGALDENCQPTNLKLFEQWKERTAEFMKKEFGENNIVNMVCHMDESRPHIHCVVIPVYDGRLAYSRKVDEKKDLEDIQTRYADMFTDLGFRRGIKGSRRSPIAPRQLRAAIDDALSNQELPAPLPNENAMDYRKRIKKEWEKLITSVTYYKAMERSTNADRLREQKKDSQIREMEELIASQRKDIENAIARAEESERMFQYLENGMEGNKELTNQIVEMIRIGKEMEEKRGKNR